MGRSFAQPGTVVVHTWRGDDAGSALSRSVELRSSRATARELPSRTALYLGPARHAGSSGRAATEVPSVTDGGVHLVCARTDRLRADHSLRSDPLKGRDETHWDGRLDEEARPRRGSHVTSHMQGHTKSADGADDHRRPLRIAVLAKQVPVPGAAELGPNGRLRREGRALEMNAYCRRAVAKGVALASASGGSCTAFTLGPASAEDVVREAVAWGADRGVHLCDAAFAGSDTLATARALDAAIRREGPFDLVLVGRDSIDSGTGQVGPELAELLDLPFASGARHMRVVDRLLELGIELEDGWEELEVRLPALVSVAERLCAPCKAGPDERRAVPVRRIARVTASELGEGPWGAAGSPTTVGSTRALRHRRDQRVLSGEVAAQVDAAVRLLAERGALVDRGGAQRPALTAHGTAPPDMARAEVPVVRPSSASALPPTAAAPVVATLVEPDRTRVAAELLGAASRLARALGGTVVALMATRGDGTLQHGAELTSRLGALGADEVLQVISSGSAAPLATEDIAAALTAWAAENRPRVVLAPSTTVGREVAARMAAGLGAGLVGDAVTVDIEDGALVAGKPAFSGSLLADISCTSPVQVATVRPGVLTIPPGTDTVARLGHLHARPRGRVRRRSVRREDEAHALVRAEKVVGVGRGVDPGEYGEVQELAKVLGAELAATRKVTDGGSLPRSRQVGITGWGIAPNLYVAIGISGSPNHVLGVQAAGTVLAINSDPSAPVFQATDVGIVGDWHEVVPLLTSRLRDR